MRQFRNEWRTLRVLLLFVCCCCRLPAQAASISAFRDSLVLRKRMARQYSEPYWHNPCGESSPSLIKGHHFGAKASLDESLSGGRYKHHFVAIRNYAESLTKLIQGVKQRKEGSDPYLPSQISLFELANFPKPPGLQAYLNDVTNSLSVSELLSNVYRLLQFAAVHLHSTENDENLFDGGYAEELEEIQRGANGLQVLMCSVKMAMNQAGIPIDRRVDHDLKSVDVSPIGDSSRRNLRDILRFDGTINILGFVHKLFSKLRDASIL